jgi:predicted nucleic acid-binding protein
MIRPQLEKEGIVISERDLQIASIAMANKLIVVTHNVKEFKRVVNLDVEDWPNSPADNCCFTMPIYLCCSFPF